MVDYLIVGQGLAGVTLAWHLHELGQSIAIIDNPKITSSSRVAAGLYNPVTGRKMTKTWKADNLFPYLESFYRDKQKQINGNFLQEKTIYRPFKSVEEQNEWLGKSSEDAYQAYIHELSMSNLSEQYQDELGGVQLNRSGFVQVSDYLDLSINYFKSKSIKIKNEKFHISQLEIHIENINYAGIQAKHIIFCRGVQDGEDSLFSWLPFAPVKGEILKITSDLKRDIILNRGVFVIPQEKRAFKVGSTYDNNDLELVPTTKARNTIVDKLNDLINVKYDIKEQYVGIRPATRDRKPFVGMHPKYKNVGIFNGLGAKGVSLAPYFANQFANHLVNQSELDKEVNIMRYSSLYKD